jgi:hypothetical protein
MEGSCIEPCGGRRGKSQQNRDLRRHEKVGYVGVPLGDRGEKKFNWASELSTIPKHRLIRYLASSASCSATRLADRFPVVPYRETTARVSLQWHVHARECRLTGITSQVKRLSRSLAKTSISANTTLLSHDLAISLCWLNTTAMASRRLGSPNARPRRPSRFGA